MKPWTDRANRFSPLKATTFAATFVPAALIAWALASGGAGPRPINWTTHETGEWAVRFLLLSLAVTPFRRIFNWPRLINVRRMLGLTALAYASIHLGIYVVDQDFDLAKVATEIVLRVYLLIGFVALLGLVALGATSTDAAIRRLGRNWNRLHRIVYAIAGLAVLHFFMQAKADVSLPTIYAGVFVLLMLYRRAHAFGFALSPMVLAGLAVLATAATMGLEVAWYGLGTSIPVERIFLANFDFSYMIRPSWWVGVIGLAVAALSLARIGLDRLRPVPAQRTRGAPAE